VIAEASDRLVTRCSRRIRKRPADSAGSLPHLEAERTPVPCLSWLLPGATTDEVDRAEQPGRDRVGSALHRRNCPEAAYRSLQEAARAALRRHPSFEEQELDWEEPAEPPTTWWCPACRGSDAPQPCLGICIWRNVEWVSSSEYERERERALFERGEELRLRQLLRRVASITPRAGRWEDTWQALRIARPANARGRAGRAGVRLVTSLGGPRTRARSDWLWLGVWLCSMPVVAPPFA
jgi:hypothetical protein